MLSPSDAPRPAVVLANGLLDGPFAKTTHGLLRGSSRYAVVAVVDDAHAGRDAGELALGHPCGVPVVASLEDACAVGTPPTTCVVGVATPGGAIPPALRRDLLAAADRGLELVNGLHAYLADDAEISARAAAGGARIVDLRRPRPTSELRFWSGEVLELDTPRVAVLGTDCAVGKRTTTVLLATACRAKGLRAEVVYTGQTGWMLGIPHGFILDATPNDFVCGELERAVVDCVRELEPDVVLLEGQSAFRNPSGPCGAELVISAGCRGVILQHAPGRPFFKGMEGRHRIPRVAEEVELVRLMGSEVWAVTIHEGGLDPDEAEAARSRLADQLGLPVFRPFHGDLAPLAALVAERLPITPRPSAP